MQNLAPGGPGAFDGAARLFAHSMATHRIASKRIDGFRPDVGVIAFEHESVFVRRRARMAYQFGGASGRGSRTVLRNAQGAGGDSGSSDSGMRQRKTAEFLNGQIRWRSAGSCRRLARSRTTQLT